jgi:phage gpG-like protein
MSVKITYTGLNLADIKKAAKMVLNNAPRAVGVLAVNHFKSNFEKGGFDNGTVKTWNKRKNDKTPGRATLVKAGHLRDSIRVVRANTSSVTIGSSKVYAKIHNEGGTINHPGGTSYFVKEQKAIFVKNTTASRFASIFGRKLQVTQPHKIPMPQRQFIGNSQTLNNKIVDWLRNTFKNALKK